MRVLGWLLLFILLSTFSAGSASAQTAAVFNQFSPSVFGMTIGGSHCYVWLKLSGAWSNEVACYSGSAVEHVQAQPNGQIMQGHFKNADGEFTWIIKPSATAGAIDWQLVGTPTGGASNVQGGTL